jgi:hypothetical protein
MTLLIGRDVAMGMGSAAVPRLPAPGTTTDSNRRVPGAGPHAETRRDP